MDNSNIAEPKHSSYYTIDANTLQMICEYCTPEFPYYTEKCSPHLYPGSFYPWHWHREVQFFYVLEGSMEYQLQSGTYRFSAGDGGYINSNILHTLNAHDDEACTFIEFLFRPSFVGGSSENIIRQKYVSPITEDSSFEIFRFNGDNEKHRKVLDGLERAYAFYEEKKPYYEMMIRAEITKLWAVFHEVSEEQRNNLERKNSSVRLKSMILYINQNYRQKITLDEIAEAGLCSKRECNRTFQSELHLTPFDYLQQIRLHQACELLVHTTVSVTNIALECGFSGSSYFTKIFRDEIGSTPKEYRANARYQNMNNK